MPGTSSSSSSARSTSAAVACEERAPLLPAPPSYSDHDTVHDAVDAAKKPSSTSRIVVIEPTLLDNDDDRAAYLESQLRPSEDRCRSLRCRLTLAFLGLSALLGVVALAHTPFFRHHDHHHPRNGLRLRDALATIPFNTNAGFCRGRGASAVAASLAALDDAYAASAAALAGPVRELGAPLRGVAITADGERAVPVAIAAALSLRRTGSVLPVELWVRGPGSAVATAAAAVAAADLAPGVVTVRAMLADADADALAGLDEDIAAAAAARSAFPQVLVLPSSAIFLADPEPLFDSDAFRSTGVLLWSSSMSASAVSGRPGSGAAALVAAADVSMLLVNKATPAFQAGVNG
ncbi:hypothetical protein HK405_007348, partial [Cladochytrium tenue]